MGRPLGRPVEHGARSGTRPTRTYNVWAYIRRVSQPGRDTGQPQHKGFHDPHWQDFRGFLEDMGECPKGFRLARHDTDKGFDAGNCYWRDVNVEGGDATE